MEQAAMHNQIAQEAYEEAILAIEESGRYVNVKSPWPNQENNDDLISNTVRLGMAISKLDLAYNKNLEHA